MSDPVTPQPSDSAQRTALLGLLPMICLHQAGMLPLLQQRYRAVATTSVVAAELNRRAGTNVYTPRPENFPWIRVVPSAAGEPSLEDLISAAAQVENPLIVAEYRHDRRRCDAAGFASTGLVGMLLMFKKLGLVESVGARLPLFSEAGFQISRKGVAMALFMAGEAP